MQGADKDTVEPLERGELETASLPTDERELLALVRQVTLHAQRTTAEDIERVRQAGWTDAQIAEAVYVTAVFAMFNRVADAFGLEDPRYRELMAAEEKNLRPAERSRPDT